MYRDASAWLTHHYMDDMPTLPSAHLLMYACRILSDCTAGITLLGAVGKGFCDAEATGCVCVGASQKR